ncbi:MAG: hypothetical protein QNJ85_12685 [Gammaproteobacteria bacterium]|nr:hypothetical protein [Gammaproteobacteria bacterium]
MKQIGIDKASSVACFSVRAIVLAFFLVSPQANATGIMLPDMGLDEAFLVIFGSFSVALVFWAAIRFTPFWRARLKLNSGLALLAKINPPLLAIVVIASGFFFLSDSWLLLIPMFLGAPLAVLGILIELIWGLVIKPTDQEDLPR